MLVGDWRPRAEYRKHGIRAGESLRIEGVPFWACFVMPERFVVLRRTVLLEKVVIKVLVLSLFSDLAADWLKRALLSGSSARRLID